MALHAQAGFFDRRSQSSPSGSPSPSPAPHSTHPQHHLQTGPSGLTYDPTPIPMPGMEQTQLLRPSNSNPVYDGSTTNPRPPVQRKYSSGNVVMWSACRDNEKCGEVRLFATGQVRGGMTHVSVLVWD
jgi:hypothetical protein